MSDRSPAPAANGHGKHRVHFSSAKADWETPPDFFAKLHAEFGFTLDVCALPENAKCERFISPEQDALGIGVRWQGRCWMNPPYGRQIGKWVEKAWWERANGHAEVMVALLPARTDTKWWHQWVMRSYKIWLLEGRLSFVGGPFPAPFPSAVVIF